MNTRVQIAISLGLLGGIAVSWVLWLRPPMNEEERNIRDAKELLERLEDDPELQAMMDAQEKSVNARRSVPPEMLLNDDAINRERPVLIDEIHAAFKDVSRAGGVSWSESDVLDGYGGEEERTAARAKDKDTSWTQLIDDPHWVVDQGIGGFSFMDAIGFRYYLPAAMIRCIRSGYDEGIQFHLDVDHPEDDLHDYNMQQLSALDGRQRTCVARFMRYMIAVEAKQDEDHYQAKAWLAALDNWSGQH